MKALRPSKGVATYLRLLVSGVFVFTAAFLLMPLSPLHAEEARQAAPVGPEAPPPEPSKQKPEGEKAKPLTQVKDSLKKLFVKDEEQEAKEKEAQEKEKAAKEAPPERPPFFPTPEAKPEVAQPTVSKEDPPPVVLRRLNDAKNPLSLAAARARLDKAKALVETNQFAVALPLLADLKVWLTLATENHIALNQVLMKVPSARAQAELEKLAGFEFAKMRDESMYLYGVALERTGKIREAIPLWVDVIRSQPRRELGVKAYEALQKAGFTEALQIAE